jgi:hypothetical protein
LVNYYQALLSRLLEIHHLKNRLNDTIKENQK